MPVARTQSRTALAVGLAGVVVGIGLFLAVILLTNTRKEISFGPDRFYVGSAESLVDNTPIPFADPVSGERPIWVQHLGTDPQAGWAAFDAQVDGCPVQWHEDDEQFVDTCTGRTYPPDGDGLAQYPVTVEKGRVVVDLRRR